MTSRTRRFAAGGRLRAHAVSRTKAASAVLALGLVCASAPAQTGVQAAWPVLHGDPGNTDFLPLAGPRVLVPAWQALQVRAAAGSAAVASDGSLYTTTLDAGPCHLYALDAAGQVRWCSSDLRWAFTLPAIGPDGSVYVTDGTEVFRFDPQGQILWRVPATGPALAPVFSREGYLVIFDQQGTVAAYDPSTGHRVAQMWVPSAPIARPAPLPAQVPLFEAGAPLAGWDPAPANLDAFVDAFFNYNTAVGNNIPAVDAHGRMFIAVAKGPAPSSQGVFYGIDFAPPTQPGDSGSFSIACSAPMGLNSSTSPALSADGQRVYAGDAGLPTPQLRAFNTSDCSQAWSIGLEAASLASPTVDLDGRIFMNVNNKVFAFRDNGTGASVLWQTSLASQAQAAGYASARVNSVLPRAANYLYAAASFFNKVGSADVPMAHVLATLDPDTGAVVSVADLGEESDSTPSMGANGQIYVPAKPLVKAVGLGNAALRPAVPAPRSGIFAFEPASYQELAADGITIALDFVSRAGKALDAGDGDAAGTQTARALRQVQATRDNLAIALQRGEISNGTSASTDAHLADAQRKLQAVPADCAQAQQALQQAAHSLATTGGTP